MRGANAFVKPPTFTGEPYEHMDRRDISMDMSPGLNSSKQRGKHRTITYQVLPCTRKTSERGWQQIWQQPRKGCVCSIDDALIQDHPQVVIDRPVCTQQQMLFRSAAAKMMPNSRLVPSTVVSLQTAFAALAAVAASHISGTW